jgi:NAD(P)H-quinone oxidoreductase subunit 4L
MLEHSLGLGAYLFCLGIYGLVTSRNAIRALMCLEIILNGVNLNLIAFSTFLDTKQIEGQAFALFIMATAAAEAAIGLAIVLVLSRNRNSARIDQFDLLRW